MKNADKSAYPQHELDDVTGKVSQVQSRGLSKRERFAMAAMQGLISVDATYNGEENKTALARDAVAHANELLKQLEEMK